MRRLLAGFWATLVLSCLSTAALAQPPAPVHDTGNPLVEPGPQEAGVTDPGEGSHFTAGGGVFLLRAFPGNDTAFNSFASTQTNSFFTGSSSTTSSVSTVTEFHHGFEVAPLVWLGYVSDSGLGGRVRWWRFAEDTSLGAFLPAASPLVGDLTRTVSLHAAPFDQLALDASVSPLGAQQLLFANRVRLNVWDLEVTEDFPFNSWRGLFAGGVRYAMLSQDYSASRVRLLGQDPATGTATVFDGSTLLAHHTFDGLGPTLALEGHFPLPIPGLALYGNLRGSVLFGHNQEEAAAQAVLQHFSPLAAGTPGGSSTTSVWSATPEAVLPVGEVELGGEWSRSLGRITPFVRAGVLGQTWVDAGSSASASGSLGFFGFTLTAGAEF